MTTTAAGYVRISEDRTGESLGVTRQAEDIAALAAARGWTLAAIHEDNDTSASGKVARPGFEALLDGLHSGAYSHVIAWNLDRLTRNRRDTVRLIEAAQAQAAVIALCRGSDLDMSTPAGRMTAEILASVARNEIEVKGDRQARAYRQAAYAGLPHWRVRPFGFEPDGTLRETEAQAIRDGAALLLEGGSMAAVGRLWASCGLKPSRAAKWSLPALRKVYVAPRIAGLAVYRGEVVGKATWAPILDDSTWQAVVAVLTNPARTTNGGDSRNKHLGSGLYLCGVCGERVYSNWQVGRTTGVNRRSYRCRTGHLQRLAEPLDAQIAALVTALLARPNARAVMTETDGPDAAPLRVERAHLEAQRTEWLRSGMRPVDVAVALAPIDTRLAAITAALLDAQRADVFAGLWTDPFMLTSGSARFRALPLTRQRMILNALFAAVTIPPGRGYGLSTMPTEIGLRLVGGSAVQEAQERLDIMRAAVTEVQQSPS